MRASSDKTLLYIPPELSGAPLSYSLAGCSAVIMAQPLPDSRCDDIRATCALLNIPLIDLTDGDPACGATECQPVIALTWISRLRTLLAAAQARELVYAQRLEQAEVELKAQSVSLNEAKAELKAQSVSLNEAKAELDSRTYRLALKLRAISTRLRRTIAWLHKPEG